jgi:hypothetical protein
MDTESEKYKKVLHILKKSEPVLDSGEDIEREVINRILKERQSRIYFSDVIDLLFGWVYIGWVRRSLIAVSIALVIMFVYQQGIILRQINFLSSQIIVTDGETPSVLAAELEKKIMIYKLSGRRFPSKDITISERELQKLLESINEMQDQYKDLQNLIENDPELKRYIEKKLTGNSRTEI